MEVTSCMSTTSCSHYGNGRSKIRTKNKCMNEFSLFMLRKKKKKRKRERFQTWPIFSIFMLQLQWWENPSSNYSLNLLYTTPSMTGLSQKNLQIRGRRKKKEKKLFSCYIIKQKNKFYILMYGMVREALYTVSCYGWTSRMQFRRICSLSKKFMPNAYVVKAETKSPTLIKTLI